jgi:chromosome segregation ATPase
MADTPESTEDLGITEDLEEIKGELTAIFHAQGQRVTEFRVVVSQGLARVQEELQSLLNNARELVQRNTRLLAEAGEAQASSDRFENMQGEIDSQLSELKSTNDQLGDDCEKLRNDREEASALRKETAEKNESIREEIHKLQAEIDRLELDNDVVRKDVTALQRKADALQKEVDALQEKRQEFLSEIAKYKEVKGSLLG